MGQNKG